MRTFGKWLGRVLLAFALAAIVVGWWKRDELVRLEAAITMFHEDRIISNFVSMRDLFFHTELPRGDGPVTPLPQGAEMALPDVVAPWMENRVVTSLLVLKDGAIVHESYRQGTGPDDLRISWSIAKSFLSALMGTVVAEGAIASLDDPVTQYAPQLIGGAYDGVSVRQVLTMTSGVLFDEDYLDFWSDIQRMGRVLALGGTMDDFAASITQSFAAPGTDWQYTSIDTHVLGMVIRGATGRPITELMQERIIAPLGLEQSPFYVTDGVGVAFVLGGLNLTTRDYARFGQMILQGGEWNGQQIVPADWIEVSTRPQAPTGPDELGYGYQWWMPKGMRPGEYHGRGIYGQYLYIDNQNGVVIVSTAADRSFREPGVEQENTEIFRAIVDAL